MGEEAKGHHTPNIQEGNSKQQYKKLKCVNRMGIILMKALVAVNLLHRKMKTRGYHGIRGYGVMIISVKVKGNFQTTTISLSATLLTIY